MQAIQTKYFGPTNARGSRIKATAPAGSMTVPYDHALNIDQNHKAAATALANKFGWLTGKPDQSEPRSHWRWLASGTLADGSQVHVLLHEDAEMLAESRRAGWV